MKYKSLLNAKSDIRLQLSAIGPQNNRIFFLKLLCLILCPTNNVKCMVNKMVVFLEFWSIRKYDNIFIISSVLMVIEIKFSITINIQIIILFLQ